MTRPAQKFRAIGCAEDLREAVGECASDDTRRYVIRRARALGRMDLVPVDWRRKPPPAAGAPDGPLQVLEQKLASHNAVALPDRRTTLPRLKAVYRRGLEAFSANPRSGVTCDQFAQTRVTSFLHLLRTGQPRTLSATVDCDLLPRAHPLAQFAPNPEFESLHPRGRDGKFIEKGGLVHVLDELGHVIGTGKVGDIKDADHISVTTSDGTVVAKAKNIEQVHEIAELHRQDEAPGDLPDPTGLASANWKGLLSRMSSGSRGMDGKLGSGVNESFFANGPDGHTYFVKHDSSSDNGVSNEIDAVNMLRTHFPGVARIARNKNDKSVMVSTLAGSDVPGMENEGTIMELSLPPEPDLAWFKLADESSVLRLRLYDLAMSNEDRHAGNLMLGRQQDGKYQLLPIDHGIGFAPETTVSDLVPQWHVAGKAAKQYIAQVGHDRAMEQAGQMMTELNDLLDKMSWESQENRDSVQEKIDYIQQYMIEVVGALAMYTPEGE